MTSEHTASSPYFTLKEAALYARCSTRTVQRWVSDKKLNRYGHGRHLLILKAEIEVLLSTPQNSK